MSTHTEHVDKNAPRTYALVLVTLLVLTGITVFAAGINFGSNTVNIIIALTIATIKASLVGLFFMHLLHDKPVNAVIMVGAFIFLGVFLGFTLTDIGSRPPLEVSTHKPPAGGPAAAEAAAAALKSAAPAHAGTAAASSAPVMKP